MKARYLQLCKGRWSGHALRDARANWRHWQAHHAELTEALRRFRDNPGMEDLAGHRHNPDGTLTSFLWSLQKAWQPEPGRLDPLLSFCDHHQVIHLRRGLVPYCQLLLEELRQPAQADPAAPELPLKTEHL